MLYRRDPRVTIGERRRQRRVTDVAESCLNVHRFVEVGSAKNNAGIRCRWPQRQVDLVTRVKSYTSGADDVFQRPLSDHKSCPPTR